MNLKNKNLFSRFPATSQNIRICRRKQQQQQPYGHWPLVTGLLRVFCGRVRVGAHAQKKDAGFPVFGFEAT